MDDLLCRKRIAPRELRVSESERCQAPTFLVKSGTGKGVQRKINAAVSEHLFVGRIDNGIHVHFRDVLPYDL